jgi:hypothetical protein
VSVITSSAEREAAVEFARAAAIRPATLRRVLSESAATPEVNQALFEILETQRILASSAKLTLLPDKSGLLTTLLASQGQNPDPAVK